MGATSQEPKSTGYIGAKSTGYVGALRLSFLGAARSVTGSRFLLEAGETRVLVDCGLSQERDMQSKNWEPFPVAPDRINAVLLTHAHLDHCGLLPRLVAEGFKGSIYATAPTAEIAKIVMLDSARLQTEDVEQKKKRHQKEQRVSPHPLAPLYTEKDAEAAASLFRAVGYGETVPVAGGLEAEFFEAGHILGSASIRVRAGRNGSARTVLFSGDIGRWDRPILKDPDPCDQADYLLMESTYGDSLHGGEEEIGKTLQGIITSTVSARGNVIIPSFAIERSQEVLYYLSALLETDRIPHLLVFLDSPMATKVTDVYRHYTEFFDQEMRDLISHNRSPFDLRGLVMARRVEDSKSINRISGSVIVIAGAGMCTGGRIKHHLMHNIARPESTILFVGYQAEGTLGRQIVEGARQVRIFGENIPVKARIARITGFSGHADRAELLHWASRLKSKPRQAFIIHGEPNVAEHFRATLEETKGWNAVVPSPGQVVELA
jgi:metallo-beta-lactamase family protein